jgi:hypothetical protein
MAELMGASRNVEPILTPNPQRFVILCVRRRARARACAPAAAHPRLCTRA